MGFHVSHITWDPAPGALRFCVRGYHPLRLDFPVHSAISRTSRLLRSRYPLPPKREGLGCSPFARRYLENQCLFLFLGLLRCFTSPSVAPNLYVFKTGCPAIKRDGLPHSEIPGSKSACDSPRHIAAYHVLHRLPVPSHPS